MITTMRISSAKSPCSRAVRPTLRISARSQHRMPIVSMATLSSSATMQILPENEAEKETPRFSLPRLPSQVLSSLASWALPALAVAVAITAVHAMLPDFALAAKKAAAAAAKDAVASDSGIMSTMKTLLSFVIHLDHHMSALITKFGNMSYALLFLIVFSETGLVIAPFLPGDSLLFGAGAFAAIGALNITALFAVFISSAILGDAANYAIGKWLGIKAFNSRLISREHVEKTERFYAKYGGKTIVLARFLPIVRTFAPFVAGVARMSYSKFATYNVLGAILWVVIFTGAGFLFGSHPWVQKNFTAVVFAIIALSGVPLAFELWTVKKEEARDAARGGAGEALTPQQEAKAWIRNYRMRSGMFFTDKEVDVKTRAAQWRKYWGGGGKK